MLATTPFSSARRRKRTSGVLPIKSEIESAILGPWKCDIDVSNESSDDVS
jgi:hypothetical protein